MFKLIFLALSVLSLDNYKKVSTQEEFLDLVGKHDKVLAVFIDEEEDDSLIELIEKIAKDHQNDGEYFFLSVHVDSITKESLEQFDITHLNEIHFYVRGFRKKLEDVHLFDDIEELFYKIKQATPIKIDHFKTFMKNTPYFFYATNSLYKERKQFLEILVQMIYPQKIFFGLSPEEERELLNGLPEQLFIYQDYERKLIPVDLNLKMNEIANFLFVNEYPTVVVPNEQSFRLMFEVKIPFLIFFNMEVEGKQIELVKMISEPYKEYFLLMVVDFTDNGLQIDKAEYLNEFMNVYHAPELRFLRVTNEKIYRNKFIGIFEANTLDYFLQNVIYENLTNYKINQIHLEDNGSGLINLNSEQFDVLHKAGKTYLIMVYSGFDFNNRLEDSRKIMEELLLLRNSHEVELAQIDFDQNNVGYLYFEDLPRFFLFKQNAAKHHYRGEISKEGLE